MFLALVNVYNSTTKIQIGWIYKHFKSHHDANVWIRSEGARTIGRGDLFDGEVWIVDNKTDRQFVGFIF
jgi:hypothetical protein